MRPVGARALDPAAPISGSPSAARVRASVPNVCARELDTTLVSEVLSSNDRDTIKAAELRLLIEGSVIAGWSAIPRPKDVTSAIDAVIAGVLAKRATASSVAGSLTKAMNAACTIGPTADSADIRSAALAAAGVGFSVGPVGNSGAPNPDTNTPVAAAIASPPAATPAAPVQPPATEQTSNLAVDTPSPTAAAPSSAGAVISTATKGIAPPKAPAAAPVAAPVVGTNNLPCSGGGNSGGIQTSGTNVLKGFSTTFSGGATLATASILNAYLNQGIFPRSVSSRCSPLNAMSVQISATAAATSSSFANYAKAEFLGLRNGLINVYFNPFAGRNAGITALQWNDRDLASDHIYMKNPWTVLTQEDAQDMPDNQLLGFWLFGLGGRGVKTIQNGTNLEAIGTVYGGFGWDSPMNDESVVGSDDPSKWGGLSFSAFVTANVANRGTIAGLFYPASTATTVDSRNGASYETVGASFTIWMPAKLYFKLDYTKGIGAVGRVMGDSTFFTFGYGSSTTATNSVTKAGQ